MKTGLTSVTFRQLSPILVVEHAKNAGLFGIEWGGDIHVPPGDIATALDLSKLTRDAGLTVMSYGSYFRALPDDNFSPILDTATALGAPVIRIWAGTKSPDMLSGFEFESMVLSIRKACKEAEEREIALVLEYHRNTFTETAQGAVQLLDAVNQPNLKTYWQPNPKLSYLQHLSEIRQLRKWLIGFHVFCWKNDETRCLLEDGSKQWEAYINQADIVDLRLLLEFVKDDNEHNFYRDVNTLKKIIKEQTIATGNHI